MNKKIKNSVAVLLCVLMMLTMLPITVLNTSGADDSLLSVLRFTNGTSAKSSEYKTERNGNDYTVTIPDYASSVSVWATFKEGAAGTITATWTKTTGLAGTMVIPSGGSTGKNLLQLVAAGSDSPSFTITAVSGEEAEVYNIKIVRSSSVAGLSAKDNNNASLIIAPDFNRDVFEYTTSVLETTNSITFTVNPYEYVRGDYKADVLVNGEPLNENNQATVSLAEEVTNVIISASYNGEMQSEYKVAVKKVPSANINITAQPGNATVFIADSKGTRILPDENGSYTLLGGDTYSYFVTLNGYKGQSGTFTANDNLEFVLEKADENAEINTDIPAQWPNFRGNDNSNAVTTAKTPRFADEAQLYWANKKGSGYDSAAIGSPIIVDNNLIFSSGKYLYKMNKYTGEIIGTPGEMVATSNFNIIPPTYAEGLIFVGLSNGRVQAFNADTLESVWLYSDSLGGQPNSPITYKDGYVYTGFWRSETADANLVCLSVSDEIKSEKTESKTATWTYTVPGGFYWSGAYVSDNFLIVGTDDGETGYLSDTSSLLSIDPKTGVLIDKISNLNGDIRSNVSYDEVTNRYYFTTKGGSFYSVSVDNNGKFMLDDNGVNGYDLKEILLYNYSDSSSSPAMSTSTPVVHNGRAYIGVSGASQFLLYSGHNITVLDLEKWEIAYTVRTMGYVQTSGLLTTAYEDEDGYAYIYFIENYTPGKVRVIKDKPGVTSVVDPVKETVTNRDGTETVYECAPVLFTPTGSQAQYAICSPIVDDDGTIYFKNDSAHMMALGSKIQSVSIETQPNKTVYKEGESFDKTGLKVVANLANGLTRDVTDYVQISDEPLSLDDTEVTIHYDYVLYGDEFDAENGNKTGIASIKPEAYVDIKVISEADFVAVENVQQLINDIGTVTLNSEKAILSARNAYDALTDELKSYVNNYDILTAAENAFKVLEEEIKSVKEQANADITGYADLSKYREAQQQIISGIVELALTQIDSAITADEITEILSAAKAEIDKVKTDEQMKCDEAVLGDVDFNGEVALEDAVLLEKHLAGATAFKSYEKKAADIDKDGEVTLEDAVLLCKMLAGVNITA